MACTVVLAAFSGQLREWVIKPKPIYMINSWDDLLLPEWKHMKIEAGDSSEMYAFTENFPDDPKAQEFKKRLIIMNDSNDADVYALSKGQIISGEIASINPYDILQIIKDSLGPNLREDIDYHISQSGRWQPYFSLINAIDDELGIILDKG